MAAAPITSCGGNQHFRVLWRGQTQNRENNPMQSRTAQARSRDAEGIGSAAAGGSILRDGANAPPQDEVWQGPHGEERGKAARLRTMLPIAGRTMIAATATERKHRPA